MFNIFVYSLLSKSNNSKQDESGCSKSLWWWSFRHLHFSSCFS